MAGMVTCICKKMNKTFKTITGWSTILICVKYIYFYTENIIENGIKFLHGKLNKFTEKKINSRKKTMFARPKKINSRKKEINARKK
jgi:hypothetical protein